MAISVRNTGVCHIKTTIHGFACMTGNIAWNIDGSNAYNELISEKRRGEARNGSI